MQAARLGLRAALRGFSRTTPRVRPSLSIPKAQQQRFASYRYQRFGDQNSSSKQQTWSNFGPVYRGQYIWRNYRPVILVAGAGGGTFYVLNLEEVPVTHRRRFNIVSPEFEKKLASAGYEQVLQEFRGKILPADHQYTQLVARVVERLLPSAGDIAKTEDWKVHVIDEPNEKNAFVMPGGKVFVFTGLLPICQDEDGVAAVLGHEIAHNVAHHSAERMSRSGFVAILGIFGAYLFDVSGQLSQSLVDIILSLPNSRTQEAEADHIGLLMMAESCYDPEAAVGLWKRMAEAEKGAPPQFMSTHPSSYNRMDTLKTWMPEAKAKLDEAGCGMTSAYSKQFQQVFQTQQGRPPSVERGRPSQVRGRRDNDDDDDFF